MDQTNRIDQLKRIAIGQALSNSMHFLPWIAELVENEQKMLEVRVITGKTEDEIRVLAARSPLSFADFVQQLKVGR